MVVINGTKGSVLMSLEVFHDNEMKMSLEFTVMGTLLHIPTVVVSKFDFFLFG